MPLEPSLGGSESADGILRSLKELSYALNYAVWMLDALGTGEGGM